MKTHTIWLFFVVFSLSLIVPVHSVHAAGETRYLFKSSSIFVRKAIGSVRHDFGTTFSADATSFQLRMARMMGVPYERVARFEVSSVAAPDAVAPTVDESEYAVMVALLDADSSHGTHMANLIAPYAKLARYDVCNEQGVCLADDVTATIREAAGAGAQIIIMGFGGPSSHQIVADALGYAASMGVLSIAAAGNNGPFLDSIDYPARYESVVAVGAVTTKGALTEWSSRDAEGGVEFSALGDSKAFSGTSMAAARASVIAARLWNAILDEQSAGMAAMTPSSIAPLVREALQQYEASR